MNTYRVIQVTGKRTTASIDHRGPVKSLKRFLVRNEVDIRLANDDYFLHNCVIVAMNG